MNANELLCYLRGFTELVTSPTEAQWTALRNEILRAKPVENQFIQVPMSLSTSPFDGRTIEANSKPCGGCRETN